MPVSQECLEEGTQESNMCAIPPRSSPSFKHGPTSSTCVSFPGVSRHTNHGVGTCVRVSRDSDPSGTDGDRRSCGLLVKAQASARLDVPTARHFLQYGPRRPTCVVTSFCFKRKLGSVHDGQPTVIMRVSAMKR